MKRFRVVNVDFDTRATLLGMTIEEHWEETVKQMHRASREQIRAGLVFQFGAEGSQRKLDDFMALGPAPFSVLAFHNKFFQQVREAFVLGAYYPALTAACALGERILNHLVLSLRNAFRETEGFKKVAKKDSFDDWKVAIGVLRTWGVILPAVADSFERLRVTRNCAIHFSPVTETKDRSLALEAIDQLSAIIEGQFAARGPLPWFMHDVPGVTFVKKAFEEDPFVKAIVLPNCHLVGPLHEMRFEAGRFVVDDHHDYGDRLITDEDFCRMATERRIDSYEAARELTKLAK